MNSQVAGLQNAEAELLKLSNKVRFVLAVVSGELKISNQKKADIEADLDAMGFDRLEPAKKASARASEVSP